VTGAGVGVMGGRGTRTQRLRTRLIAGASSVAQRLPERPLLAGADSVGELWYRATPGRAAMARANLGRVCAWLDAEGRGPARARRAASDPRALESLVRAAYRHAARYYLELLRAPGLTEAYVGERLRKLTPEVLEAANADPRGVMFIGAHLGPIEIPAFVAGHEHRPPVVGVMETIDDPELQGWIARSRASTGVRLVSLDAAHRELRGAIEAGGLALLVVDRDITGGGTPTELFGHPAPLPTGAAILAAETGARLYFQAMLRVGDGRYRAWMREIPVPAEGRLRARVTAVLEATARAIEDAVVESPEQWWAVFFPIWPDLAATDATASAKGDG
jgi:phosphatidylinositol dimannoside acyltransferase